MAPSRQVRRRLRWPLVVGTLVAALALAAVSWADEVVPDGDIVAAGDQASVNLGTVSPGQVLSRSVSFKLVCSSKQHVDNGQTLPLTFNLAGSTVPTGGTLGATNASVGPVPSSWPDDTSGGGSTNCGSPLPTPISDNGDSTVTITAPSAPGSYAYTVRWNYGALTPAGSSDSNAVTGNHTDVTFTLTVAALDTTAPTVSCAVPNQSVWYGSNVTVNCTASDSGSGLANAGDASFSLATSVPGGTETASASTDSRLVCDNTSNCATAGPYTFEVDRKAPDVSCGSADGVWHADDVSIACTASDGGSDLADAGDASFSLSTNVPAGSEDANASTGTHQVCDNVGHCATAGPIDGNEVDRKAPQLSGCDAPDGLWHGANVTLQCHYTDGGSGAGTLDVDLQTNVAADTEDADASASANGAQACDAVGNCAASPSDIGGNKVDKKKPQVDCSVPDQSVWYGDNVAVDCAASDSGSGLANPADASFSLSTTVASGSEDAAAQTGQKTVADGVGNSDSVGPYTFKVDRKGPVVTVSCAATVLLGSSASASWAAVDGGSGVKPGEASGTVPLDTSSVGPKTATVPAGSSQDNVDNPSAAASCPYSVIYNFAGFFAPVNSPGHYNGVLNSVKAGSAVPLKFSLGGNQGLSVIALGYPKWIAISCDTSEALDPILDGETVTAGSSNLSYDASAGQYVYVWKSDKAWAGSCKRLQLKLNDLQMYTADFKFTK